MNLDGIIHSRKNFGEIDDADVAEFLRGKNFKSEYLNLEFKSVFPPKGSQRYDIREFCKYIVGLSNEEGGLVIYGVSDDIKDEDAQFPDYVVGLTQHPTLEDLSQWVKERVHPLIASPSIRLFHVQGRKIAIIKVPAGVNKPYCYYDPSTKSISHFKKTAGGIAELTPDEVREFYRTSMIEQASNILRALELQEGAEGTRGEMQEQRLKTHQSMTKPKLENVKDYGFLGIYCIPIQPVDLTTDRLNNFMMEHKFEFSEVMRYSRSVEQFQSGISVGYFPRSIRQDVKSTVRITLYKDGLIAFDGQADHLMDKDRNLNPYWLAYEIQRHLQLSRAALDDFNLESLRVIVELDNVEDFSMNLHVGYLDGGYTAQYTGAHHPIEKDVNLSDIHEYDGEKRNIVMSVVKEITDEVCRIFGFSKTLHGVWDEQGKLGYVKNLENQR